MMNMQMPIKYLPAKGAQQGIGLVELMVALVLGLLVSAAVLQLFLTNRQTFGLQQGLASVQEQGRFAVDFLSKEFMSAGAGDVSRAFAFAANPVDGKSSGDGALQDTVVILLKEGTDCSGGAINVAASAGFVAKEQPWKRYSVNQNALTCTDSDGTTNVLVDNVDAFQVLYGVKAIALKNGVSTPVQKYLKAADVSASDTISSLRFAVLVASEATAVSERQSAIVLNKVLDNSLANNAIDFKDGRLRRLFVSTVAVRNLASNL